jgi:hypothetical protein
MQNFAIPFLDAVQGIDEREKRAVENKNTRLANRKALMEIAQSMSDQGQTMGMEDFAKATSDLLGPAAFLSSTAPSQDMLSQLMKQQNAAAAQKAEMIRRDQFRADAEESKTMEDFASGLLVGGADDVSTYEQLVQRFGADRVEKIKNKLPTIKNKALFEAENQGKLFGKDMLVDEATEYVKGKDFLPEPTRQAIIKTATANSAAAEKAVLASAEQMGMSGGFTDSANDSSALRNLITTSYPGMGIDAVEQLHNKALQIARAASERKVVSTDYDLGSKARATSMAADSQLYQSVIGLEEKDRQAREQSRQQFSATNSSPLQEQASQLALVVGDPKKKQAPLFGKDDAKTGTMTSIVQGYVVPPARFEELRKAVDDGDSKKIREITATFDTTSAFRSRVEDMGRLTSMQFTGAKEFYTSLPSDRETLEAFRKRGREFSDNMQVFNSGGVVKTGPRYAGGNPRAAVSSGGATGNPRTDAYNRSSQSTTTSGYDSPTRMASRAAADTLKSGIVQNISSRIIAMREAANINGSFSASPEEIAANERAIVSSFAGQFLEGTGLSRTSPAYKAAVDEMAAAVSENVGPATGVTRRKTAADMLQDYRNSTANNLMLSPNGRAPYGSIQPSVRSGTPPF